MRTCIALVVLVVIAAPASAQWTENFDSYGPAPMSLHGVGGWNSTCWGSGWAGTLSGDQARSAPYSMRTGFQILQHTWPAGSFVTGQWSLRMWVLFGTTNNSAWFTVFNGVDGSSCAGWDNECIHIDFNQWGQVEIDSPILGGSGYAWIPNTYTWYELRMDIDLNANTQTTWFNGVQLGTGAFSHYGGPAEIRGIEMYNGGFWIYCDDLSLQPPPPVWNLNVHQPSGSASLYFTNSAGVPGTQYLNAVSLVVGAMPTGWFYGINIPPFDLAQEYFFGPPFSGTLDGLGGAQTIVPGPIPPNIPVEIVALNLQGGVPIDVTAPFGYVTVP